MKIILNFWKTEKVGLKKRALSSLYNRTGVCTIRALIKTTKMTFVPGTKAKFRPFDDKIFGIFWYINFHFFFQFFSIL